MVTIIYLSLVFLYACFTIYYITLFTIIIVSLMERPKNKDGWSIALIYLIDCVITGIIGWLLFVRWYNGTPLILSGHFAMLIANIIKIPIATWFFYRFFILKR